MALPVSVRWVPPRPAVTTVAPGATRSMQGPRFAEARYVSVASDAATVMASGSPPGE